MEKPIEPSNKEYFTYHYVKAETWDYAKFLSSKEYEDVLENLELDDEDDPYGDDRPWPGSPGGTQNCIKYAEKKHKHIDNLWPLFEDMFLSPE